MGFSPRPKSQQRLLSRRRPGGQSSELRRIMPRRCPWFHFCSNCWLLGRGITLSVSSRSKKCSSSCCCAVVSSSGSSSGSGGSSSSMTRHHTSVTALHLHLPPHGTGAALRLNTPILYLPGGS